MPFKCEIDNFPVIKYDGKFGPTFSAPHSFNWDIEEIGNNYEYKERG